MKAKSRTSLYHSWWHFCYLLLTGLGPVGTSCLLSSNWSGKVGINFFAWGKEGEGRCLVDNGPLELFNCSVAWMKKMREKKRRRRSQNGNGCDFIKLWSAFICRFQYQSWKQKPPPKTTPVLNIHETSSKKGECYESGLTFLSSKLGSF